MASDSSSVQITTDNLGPEEQGEAVPMDDMDGLGGLEFAEGSKPPVALDWRIAPPAAMRQHVPARGIRKAAADPPATLVPAIDRRPHGACAGMAEKLESPLTAATGILSRATAAHRYCAYLRNVHRLWIGATMSGSWPIQPQHRGRHRRLPGSGGLRRKAMVIGRCRSADAFACDVRRAAVCPACCHWPLPASSGSRSPAFGSAARFCAVSALR
ncbi:hypothetical protein HDC36_001033 [Xanthomonas sp. JAI131]|uniref:hypothetical protein n=1 Tax=Xanthomonas sp. JAI131 TaxID=2723067 RepID=UPI0015CBA52F|nr:hypothetical protein [Xanthomonas sp. JAI131]NYF19596.1 hypothetical protein [Xanthomonas sp. JAI131]